MSEHQGTSNSKERIIDTAARLFSEKGFDGARVNDIAREAEVNKALIYYYFPSKQAILTHIIDSFFQDMLGLGMDFIRDAMAVMIREGRLTIYADRMHFSAPEDLQEFKAATYGYYLLVYRYMMQKRNSLRIILSEALRGGAQRNALFRFFMSAGESDGSNPLFDAVSAVGTDLSYSKEVVFRKFFFSLLPIINIVVFQEDYKAAAGLNDSEMLDFYTRSLDVTFAAYVSNQDILMDTDEIRKYHFLKGGDTDG